MQFQSLLIVAGALVSSAYAAANITVTETESTLVTITSCSENKCATTVSPAIPSVATVTVAGVVTEYTTYCPLTAEEAKESASKPATVAGESVVESTASVVTYTVSGVETYYTTYCPLTASSEATPEVATSAAAEVSSSSEEVSYVDITSTPTVYSTTKAQETVYAQSTLFTSYAGNGTTNGTTAGVSTYEGAANSNSMAVGFAALAGLAAVLL